MYTDIKGKLKSRVIRQGDFYRYIVEWVDKDDSTLIFISNEQVSEGGDATRLAYLKFTQERDANRLLSRVKGRVERDGKTLTRGEEESLKRRRR